MPDPAQDAKSQTTLQQVRDVLLALAAVISAIGAPIMYFRGNMHTEEVKANQNGNTEALQKHVDTKAGKIIDNQKETKDTLIKAKTEETAALEPQLFSTWVYLESTAKETGDPAIQAKANEAFKVYQDYKKKIKK